MSNVFLRDNLLCNITLHLDLPPRCADHMHIQYGMCNDAIMFKGNCLYARGAAGDLTVTPTHTFTYTPKASPGPARPATPRRSSQG